jgi:hypothetical protein
LSKEEPEVEKMFNLMMLYFKKDSTKSAEVQAHHIMRSAAEKIHVAFRESNRESLMRTPVFVTKAMTAALHSFNDLIKQIGHDDNDSEHLPVDS